MAMINYVDRFTMSFAIGPISQEFGLSTVAKGYLFSSFLWTYTLFLIPVGLLVDKFGSKRVAAWGLGIWSVATAVTGVASGFTSILLCRLVMGGGESTTSPAGAGVIREWMPASERGMANAAFNTGAYAEPAVGALLAGSIVQIYGWRVLFYVAGVAGLIWVLAWALFYDRPRKARWLGEDEPLPWC